MKKNLVSQIIDQFTSDLSELQLFSNEELDGLKLLAMREELANKSKVESFLNSATAIVEDSEEKRDSE